MTSKSILTFETKAVGSRISPGDEALREQRTNEVFIAIVAPAGAGAGTAAAILKSFFEDDGFEAEIVKASHIIHRVAEQKGLQVPDSGARKSLSSVRVMQDRGDELRKGDIYGLPEDHSAVARLMLPEIAKIRANFLGLEYTGDKIRPDGKQRAYIIDSLRHPAEVAFLREVYQQAFALIGVVCEPTKRERRIRENLFDRTEWGHERVKSEVKEFLLRDENSPKKFGQHVAQTFEQSDFFVDNTEDTEADDLFITGMNDHLRRFVHLIAQNKIIRPTIAETAMHHARSAQMRSACLSRQVGAALVDANGNIVATGTNDAPKAGGGLYGEGFASEFDHDERCAFRETVFCSSNKEQNNIINELIEEFPELKSGSSDLEVLKKIRSTRIGGLIEFSRAVHAEMNAILSAAISGISPKGCRMYVTTYPCHYCARHIIAAGIDELQFIEPYPKSKATELHNDAITTEAVGWDQPSSGGKHVLFRPFVGVAPRLYRKVFFKDRKYKDSITGDFKFEEPEWGRSVESYKSPYFALEQELSLELSDE